MPSSEMRTHDKWASLPTQEIQKYLKKYNCANAPGKASARRRRKIEFLLNVMKKRDKAMRLITSQFSQ